MSADESARLPIPLAGHEYELRALVMDDAEAIASEANDEQVSAQLRDLFPFPYSLEDAETWLGRTVPVEPAENLAIAERGGVLVGVIGLSLENDVLSGSAEIGYWLGRRSWGRGLASAAVQAFVPYAFSAHSLRRLQASVFGGNEASARVLAKAGFRREGCLRRAVVKRSRVADLWLYGLLRDERAG